MRGVIIETFFNFLCTVAGMLIGGLATHFLSKDISRQIERAYVHAQAIYQRTEFPDDTTAAIYTEITVLNYGKTPAIINVIKTLKNFEPKISAGQETDVFSRRFIVGILNKEPFITSVVHCVRVEDWEDIKSSAKQLFFLVRVEYQDIFETPYTKDFWWIYKPIDRAWSVHKDHKEKQNT
jgi:hypothetical protein